MSTVRSFYIEYEYNDGYHTADCMRLLMEHGGDPDLEVDETGILDTDERIGAKKVLTAAAMTYVAALAVSIGNLLRLIFIVNRRRK